MANYEELLHQLKEGEIKSIEIDKDQFYAFREVLIRHPLFKHFRGDAKQSGRVIYTYIEVARS